MGFSFRKSFGSKLFRFNLTGKGIGISTGAPGMRLSKRIIGTDKGKTMVYAQKSVLGNHLRYVKSVGGSSNVSKRSFLNSIGILDWIIMALLGVLTIWAFFLGGVAYFGFLIYRYIKYQN